MDILKTKNFYLVALFTVLASLSAKYIAEVAIFKIFGHLVVALVIGMITQKFLQESVKKVSKELGFISNKFLRLGIILLGTKLSIDKLLTDGKKTLLLAFFVVIFMIILTYFVCRFFKIERELALLASCGCGICGAAAVMGVSSQLNAKTDNSVLAVAVVAILGTVFTFIEVTIQPYLGLTATQYGIFTGASLHEIAHAVAAGGAGGTIALDTAVLTKLSRVLMLVVVILGLALLGRGQKTGSSTKAPLPYFIIGFILMSFLGSYVAIFKIFAPTLSSMAYIFLGMAMFSLGLSVNFEVLKKRGSKILAVCFGTSLTLMVVSYLVAKFMF